MSLFASGDSQTKARLIPACPRSLRLDQSCKDYAVHHILLLELVFQHISEFDLIHFHVDYSHYPLSRRHRVPHLTTLHGRLDLPELASLYREFTEVPVVSISDAQRKPLPWINWQGTVYHGLPEKLYRFHETPGKYLAFLGRVSPEKRLDRAIELAKRTGMELKIAAKIDPADRDYFESEIKHLLDHPLVEFLGEIGGREKEELLGNAYALLFPIDWPEPFGLVMIEAMACGTPVIAWRRGSVPEIMEDGVTGFIVTNMDEATEAVYRVPAISRIRCRKIFEERFSVARMTRDYLAIYESVITTQLLSSQQEGQIARGSHPPQRAVLHPRHLAPGRQPHPGTQE